MVPFTAAVAEAMGYLPRCIGVLGVGATLTLDLYGRASPVPVLAGDLAVVQPAVNAIKAGDRSHDVRAALAGPIPASFHGLRSGKKSVNRPYRVYRT